MPETPRDGQWQPGLAVTVIVFAGLGGALAGVFPALITLTPGASESNETSTSSPGRWAPPRPVALASPP